MTAKTAASHVAQRVLQNPSDASNFVLSGQKLAGTYYPGDVVYESAAGVWTTQASNAGHLARTGVVGDISSPGVNTTTWARRSIDSIYATTDLVDIIISGIVVCKIADQSGTVIAGAHFINHNAGQMTISSGVTVFPRGCLKQAVASGDTYALMAIGAKMFQV